MFSSNTSQVSSDANYIEDVFSTYLYTGNGSTQTINNGIDLAGKGGMVWTKERDSGSYQDHVVLDTVRGLYPTLCTNNTNAQFSDFNRFTSWNSNGYTLSGTYWGYVNESAKTYASWTFRKQPKFFDVVTYTGNGVDGRAISHNLGAIPRFIIVKRTDASAEWRVYAYTPTGPQSFYLALNTTGADGQVTGGYVENPTLTQFRTYAWSGDISTVNASGGTYVAYLFASNAGGFGLTGTDNVISCGSYTGNGSSSGPVINLGYEPQWVMIKNASAAADWVITDNMRGWTVAGQVDGQLFPNSSASEISVSRLYPTSTGFGIDSTSLNYNTNGSTYIYIAIRRGPMKTPTTGTSVFSPQLEGGTAGTKITTNFPIDWQLIKARSSAQTTYGITRLTGVSSTTTEAAGYLLQTASTATELADSTATRYWDNTGFQVPSGFAGASSTAYITENFQRAPGFFDVVCYTGNATAGTTVAHNLTVVPEMMIVKSRSNAIGWLVYHSALGNTGGLYLNLTTNPSPVSWWNSTTPTSTVFTLGSSTGNNSGATFVAYLFASCPGVSKVTNFTGNGSTQTINCGFTGGARFVMIKATSTTGNWLVFDTARGMTTSTDPWLALNSTAAESATTGACTTTSVGFTVDESKLTGVNTNGVSYIAFAIA